MAIRFQYNKISLQSLNKQLKIRVQALPILKNKESALRIEVKKARNIALKYDELPSVFAGKAPLRAFGRIFPAHLRSYRF